MPEDNATPLETNVQKTTFYKEGLKFMRKAPGGAVIQPFGGEGKSVLTEIEGVEHYACERNVDRALAFRTRHPTVKLVQTDNLEWFETKFHKGLDVVVVDFDATSDPFHAFEVFVEHADLRKPCLAFFTWGYRKSPRLQKFWKAKKKLKREDIWRVMRKTVMTIADPRDISVRTMGMQVPTVGRSRNVIYGMFSLVRKGGEHLEGEPAGDDQEMVVELGVQKEKGLALVKHYETARERETGVAQERDVWRTSKAEVRHTREPGSIDSLPVMGFARFCNTCFLNNKCPVYKEDSTCKVAARPEIRNGKDLQNVLTRMLEVQTERITFGVFMEKVQGTALDERVTRELKQLFEMVKSFKESTNEYAGIEIKAKGSGAVADLLSKFSGRSDKPQPVQVSSAVIDIETPEDD